MAAVVFNAYDSFRLAQWLGTSPINFATATIKIALVTSAYTPDQNLHDFFNDITNELSNATNSTYTDGGNAAASPTVTMDTAGIVTIGASDPATWPVTAAPAGFATARRAIAYADTGTPSTSRLIGYSAAFTADKGNVDGDFDVDITDGDLMTQARS